MNTKNNPTLYGIRYSVLIYALLCLTTLGLYYQVGNFEFINFDDDEYITENIHLKEGALLKKVKWCFTATYANNWHPLTWLSHLLDIELYGYSAGKHHLTNVFFHIFNTLLLFTLLQKITNNLGRSAFVAALFAVHPLHVESVAWVAERKDVMSAFFFLLTLISYHSYSRHPGFKNYMLTFLLLTLGLMSKPMLVTTPFVLLLLDYWPLNRIDLSKTTLSRSEDLKELIFLVIEKIPLLLPVIFSTIITFSVQKLGGAVAASTIYPLDVRLANALIAYVTYIFKMVWPAKLAIYYPHPGMPSWQQILGYGLLFTTLSVFAFFLRKRYPYILVGWLWYLGMLVPVIGLIQVGSQAMADRYTYLPLIGLFIIIAWGVPDLLKNRFNNPKIPLIFAFISLVILFLISQNQIRYWKNSITLFQHALEVTEDNFIAHHNLGVALSKRGHYNEAIEHYAQTLRIVPNYVSAHHNMGIALAKQGKQDEAIQKYNDVLHLAPNHKEVYFSLGNAMVAKGMLEQAVSYFQKAIKLNPSHAETYNNLGVVLFKLGMVSESIANFQAAIKINPHFTDARKNLQKILKMQNGTN